MWEWWKGLPVAWTSTVKVCVDCCCCQWRTREWTASMSRCWGTELKKPTRSSLVACSEMSGEVTMEVVPKLRNRHLAWMLRVEVLEDNVKGTAGDA